MTVKCLITEQKDAICRAYTHKTLSITDMAKCYKTSTRTISRVLEERGLATPVPRLKGEAYQVMQLLKQHNLDIDSLKDLLARPIMTVQNVQLFLNQCTKEELARFFYVSGLAKLAEIAAKTNANQQQQAANVSESAKV